MYRIGSSQDIHRLEENGRPFILGGIKIPFEKGPVSHSDGDCLFHALGEAILGALALGDLGTYFPDNDDKYLNIDSSIILKEILKMMNQKGYEINNVDLTIILERPRLKNYIMQIRSNISKVLDIDIDLISVKAQTNEHCDEIGLNKAVQVNATVLLRKKA